ncbi:MAG: T9SS type A sorting domain-containing protein [candidate division Zixibacteria bacterium]|nr:T9SS type A sorting domain-containing protein [candidate division Zixibacteria bacterium]
MMRNIATILMVVFLTVVFYGLANSADRMVIGELFSSSLCPHCPPAEAELNQVLADQNDHLTLIRYHIAPVDPFWQWDSLEIKTRYYKYLPGYTPHFYIDGNVDGGSSVSSWDGMITDRSEVSSPIIMDIVGTYDNLSRDASIDFRIDVVDTVPTNYLRLYFGLTESDLYYAAPNGTTIHNQVFRDFISSDEGDSVFLEIGHSYIYHVDFNLDTEYNDDNVEIFAFVQISNTNEILQAVKADITQLSPGISPWISCIVQAPESPGPDESCYVSSKITDSDGIIDSAIIYFDTGSGYTSQPLNTVSDSFFIALPGQPDLTTVDYYILATDDSNNTMVSDTFSYIVEYPDEYCLSCSALTSTPRVPNEDGEIMWDLYITNCGREATDVYGEIYPIIGDCMGTQSDSNIRSEITTNLLRGGSHTGYYYYRPGDVTGVTDASLSISLGFWYEYWLTSCCFEFEFTYAWGRPGSEIVWEPGVWGEIGDDATLPEKTVLNQNFPNPFNASTTISFDLHNAGDVNFGVYNMAGQKIETLIDGYLNTGQHLINWDASAYSSGIYFYKLQVGGHTSAKMMSLLK